MGDIYPGGVQLGKGECTIRLHLRHDDAGLLEKLKARGGVWVWGCGGARGHTRARASTLDCLPRPRPPATRAVAHPALAHPTPPPQALPMVVERKLDGAIQVPAYRLNSDAVKGEHALGRERALCPGERAAFFLAPPPDDKLPKDATPGERCEGRGGCGAGRGWCVQGGRGDVLASAPPSVPRPPGERALPTASTPPHTHHPRCLPGRVLAGSLTLGLLGSTNGDKACPPSASLTFVVPPKRVDPPADSTPGEGRAGRLMGGGRGGAWRGGREGGGAEGGGGGGCSDVGHEHGSQLGHARRAPPRALDAQLRLCRQAFWWVGAGRVGRVGGQASR